MSQLALAAHMARRPLALSREREESGPMSTHLPEPSEVSGEMVCGGVVDGAEETEDGD